MKSCNAFWINAFTICLILHCVNSNHFDCNFKHNPCEWKVIRGWSPIRIDSGGMSSDGVSNDLLSPRHKPTNGSCLTVSIESGDTAIFSVIIEKEGERPETLYRLDDEYYYQKVKDHVTIQSRKFFKIRLHADVSYYDSDTPTQSYLYGVTLKETACRDTVFDCDFEDKDICDYKNVNYIDGLWKRKNENSSFSKEGHPKYDHTSGPYGSYLYVSDKDMLWGDFFYPDQLSAIISSEDIPKGNYCITIWYQIYGKAKLHLSCESDNHMYDNNEIVSSCGNGVWNTFQFSVNIKNEDFKLMLEGKIISRTSNWIAVDDIDVNKGDCAATGFCEFTTNLCTWSNMYCKDRWMVATSKTPGKPRDGPLYDVNSKGGYAYLRKHIDDRKEKFATARLLSVNIDSSKYKCFKFRYHMPKNIGSLSIITADIEGKEKIRWTLHGKQKQDWQQGTVPLSTGNSYGNMNLIIQGKLYTISNQTIAVDDVGFFTDSCDLKPTVANPVTLNTTAVPMESTTKILSHSWKTFDCDFNHRLCEWTRKRGWKKYLGKRGLSNNGVVSDLISPEHGSTNGSCLTISSKAGDTAVFSVIVEEDEEKPRTVYQVGSRKHYKYRKVYVTIQSRNTFKIILHAARYDSWDRQDIQLFEISLKEVACRDTVYDCDFEDDECGYLNTMTYIGSWKRRNENSSFSDESHPAYDHSFGAYGSYLYLSRKEFHWNYYYYPKSLKTTIISEYIKSGKYCVTIWYQIYGKAELHLLCRSHYDRKTHKFTSSYGSGVWNAFQFQVNFYYKFKLSLEGNITSRDSNWIAVDDVDVNYGDCSPPGFCDFSTNLCTWSNMFYEEKWIVVDSKQVDAQNGGPESDGKNTGGYAFFREHIDDSNAKSVTARLMSVEIDSSKYKCFKFRYYSSEEIGSLSVISADFKGKETVRWTLLGKQKQHWQQGTVPLSTGKIRGKMNIIIQGRLYKTSNQSIAVDDVGFVTDSCDLTPTSATPIIQVTTVAPFESSTERHVVPSKSFDCDFNNRLCEWKRIYGWSNYLGTGGIISKGDKNDLISPEHEPTNGSCLIISFKSGEVSSFSVIIEKNGGSSTTVYQIGSSSPYIYRKGYVTIESRKIFKIRLHAEGGYSSWYMRVRNAMLYGVTMKEAACRDTAYDCDFEDEDICEYMNFNTYVGSWKRRNENSSFSTESHPKYDHTLGTYGSYLYLSRKKMNWGFYGNPPSLQATVRSQYVKTGRYCVTIWYQIYGDALLNLLLKSYHDDETHKCPSSYGSGVWNAFQFPVNSTSRFRLYFKGTITLSDANWIAVDDVDINNGDCSPPGFCDFSTNLCTWSNMFYEDKWIVVDSKTVDKKTSGPVPAEKTTGGYAYFRKRVEDSETKSPTARLLSTNVDTSKYKCFKFQYYMHGENMGSLSVITADSLGNESIVWELHGSQQHVWQHGTVPLSTAVRDKRINLIIQAKLSTSSNEIMAVDDVGFFKESCHIKPAIANPVDLVTTVTPFISTRQNHTMLQTTSETALPKTVCTVNTMLQTTSETALPKTETTKKYNSATTSNSPTSHTPRQTHSITTTSLPTTSQTAKQTPSTTTTTASTNFKTPKRTPKTKTTNIPTYETSKQSLSTATMKNSPTTSEIPKRTPSKTTASLPTKSQTAKQTPSTTTTTASTTFKTPKRTPKTKTTNIPIYETSKQRLSTATMKNSPTTSETPKQTSSKTTAISLPTKSETAKQTPSTTITTASTTFKTPKRTPKTKTTNISTYETTKQTPSKTTTNYATTSRTPEFFTSVETTETSTTPKEYKYTTSKMPVTGISKTSSTSEATGKTGTSGTKSTKEFARTTPQVSNNVVFLTTKGWKGDEAKSKGSRNAEKSKTGLGGPAGISGIVIGILIIILTVTVAIYIHRRRRIRKTQEGMLTTGNRFENPLFEIGDATFSQSQA